MTGNGKFIPHTKMVIFLGDGKHGIVGKTHDQICGDEPRSLAGLVMASRRLSLLVLTRCSLTVGIPRSDVKG